MCDGSIGDDIQHPETFPSFPPWVEIKRKRKKSKKIEKKKRQQEKKGGKKSRKMVLYYTDRNHPNPLKKKPFYPLPLHILYTSYIFKFGHQKFKMKS